MQRFLLQERQPLIWRRTGSVIQWSPTLPSSSPKLRLIGSTMPRTKRLPSWGDRFKVRKATCHKATLPRIHAAHGIPLRSGLALRQPAESEVP